MNIHKINFTKREQVMGYRIAAVFALFLLSFIFSKNIQAQTTDIGIPSPTAAGLGEYAKAPVNLSKGTAQISIPLFTVSDGNLGVPISLSYNTSGVKVGDIADWVGLNWSLNAGGVITRAARGKPDEVSGKGYYFRESSIEEISIPPNLLSQNYRDEIDYIDSLHTSGVDLEPDMFYFNFPGQSGAFILGFDGDEPMTIPKNDLKIDPVMVSSNIKGFVIKDPSGNSYHFSEIEKSLRQPGTAATQPEYPSAWYLTRIESVTSVAEIELTYYDSYDVVHEYIDINAQTENDETLTELIYQKHERINLKSIESRSHLVEFIRFERTDADIPSTWLSNPGGNQTQGLDSVIVKVKTNSSDNLLTTFDLIHSYPGNGQRLFLDEIKKFGSDGTEQPFYKFDYYNSGSLPSRTSLSIDHWGYYNGKANDGLIPSMIFSHTLQDTTSPVNFDDFFKGADRKVNPTTIKYGTLEKITKPTGGSHTFVYEPNDYSDVFFDDITQLYDFVLDTAISSGEADEINDISFTIPSSAEDLIIDLYVLHDSAGTYRDFDRFTLTNTSTSESYYFDFTAPEFGLTERKYFKEWYFSEGGNFTVDIDFSPTYDDSTEIDDLLLLFKLDVYFREEVNIKKGSGLRIKEIQIDDGDSSTPDITKHFEYHYTEGSETFSNGILFAEPDYRVFQTTGDSIGLYFLGLTSNNGYEFGNANSGLALYKSVSEYETGTGKTVHLFSNNSALLNDKMQEFNYDYLYPTAKNLNTPVNHYLGYTEEVSIYNETEEKLRETTSKNYLEELIQEPTRQYLGVNVRTNNQNGSLKFKPYYLDNPIIAPSYTINKVINGANTLSSRVDFEYDTLTTNPAKETRTNSDGSKIITEYAYAHEEFTAMADSNMLTQPYSVTLTDNSGNVLSKNWTVWSNQTSGNPNWNVRSQWEWIGNGTTTDTTAPTDTTGSEVLKVMEITKYDSFGNPLEVKDARNTKTAYQFSEDGTTPIGIFQNAESEHILAHSFAYDSLSSWTETDLSNGFTTDWSIDTGKLKMSHDGTVGTAWNPDYLEISLTSEITSRAVIEMDIEAGKNNTHYSLFLAAGGNGSVSPWATFYYGQLRYFDNISWKTIKTGFIEGETYTLKMVIDPSTDKIDYYIDGILEYEGADGRNDISGIDFLRIGNYGRSSAATDWYVDNVRIYPEEAQATSQEADPLFGTPLAIKDVSGSTNRFSYDSFGRLKEAFNPNGQRVSRNEYSYSLDTYSSFDAEDPNRVENIIYNDPADTTDKTISVSYLDGLGRAIQSQTRATDGTAIVTGTLYDAQGRPHITSRPIELNVNSYTNGYVNDLWGTGFDGNPGEALPTNSEIYQYYDTGFSGTTDAQYAYTQSQFEASPLSRAIASGNAASALRLGQNESTMDYGLNSGTEDFSGFTDNELNKTVSTDPNGNHTFSFTDGWGNTIATMTDMDGDSTKDSDDLVTQFQYDLRNQLKKVTDPRGLETDYTYNQRGQLVEKDMPDKDDPDDYRYDSSGNLRFVESAKHKNNGSTTLLIDQEEEGTFNLTMPGDGVVEFDVSLQVAGEGPEVRYKFGYTDGNALYNNVFDAWETSGSGTISIGKGNYKVEVTEESTGYQYQILHSMDFKPYKFTYNNYDELNRITETGEYYGDSSFTAKSIETNVSGNNISMQKFYYGEAQAHDSANYTKGRLAKVEYRDLHVENLWGTTWYSYNSQGLVEWIIQDLPGSTMGEKKIEYVYDELGRMTEMKFQEGTASEDYYFRYTYDDLGRLSKTESRNDPAGSWVEDAEYTYFADGQLEELNLGGNDQSVDYSYNSAGWLRFINDPDGFSESSPGFSDDHFGLELRYYNNVGSGDAGYNGNIGWIEWEQYLAGTSTDEPEYAFNYDRANRLTDALYENSSGTDDNSNGLDVDYQYDKNGNMDQFIRYGSGGGSDYYTIEQQTGQNRIDYLEDQVSFDKFYVEYDANGNMISNELNGLESARYDSRNLSYTLSGASSTVYHIYDADGQRISKKEGSTSTSYIRGADGQTVAVYENGSIDKWNILSGGDVVGTVTSGGAKEYFLKDHLGSTRAVVNSSGTAVAYFDFYPYGKLMPGRYTTSNDDRYKFTGHELDEEAGLDLSYAGARYLDSEIGAWLSIDPLADSYPGWSPYNYALNNPMLYTDPTGNCPTITVCINIAQAAANVTFSATAGSVGAAVTSLNTAASVTAGGLELTYGIIGAATGYAIKKLTSGSDSQDQQDIDRDEDRAIEIFDKHDSEIEALINYGDRTGAEHEVPGGLAGAVAHELRTGEKIKGADHVQKAYDILPALDKKIRAVTNSYSLSDEQRKILLNRITSFKNDILDALKTEREDEKE